jgi:hypothetical protein
MKKYRRVTIKRKLPFYHEQQEELRDWFSDANTAIGAFWEKGGSSKQGSGMTLEEEALVMPSVLSIPLQDPNFRREVSNYFRDINTVIPQDGLPLVISLEDDDMELSRDNMPVKVDDYIKYRHAVGHPFTAMSEYDARSNPLKRYYVEDQEEIVKQERAKVDEVDKALSIYFEIKKNKKKVNMVLALMGASTEEGEDATVALKSAAEKDPLKFHKVATDDDLQLKYEISSMVSEGVLDLVKGKYIRTDTAETLGTEMQTVAWFKDKSNSKDIAMFKAMMQEMEA